MSGHICDRGGGFFEAISFLFEKNCSLFHSSALRVFVGRQCIRFLIELILVGYQLVFENAVSATSHPLSKCGSVVLDFMMRFNQSVIVNNV